MTASDREAILDGIRHWYRSHAIPYELRLPSGAVEDETGAVHPGFRSALPRAAHSDGWNVTDVHQSPEYPDPDRFPQTTVEYAGPEGTAEVRRTIEVRDEVRHERFRDVVEGIHYTVLAANTLQWTGERSGEPMSEADRERILNRIRSVYDEWGYPYDIRERGGSG